MVIRSDIIRKRPLLADPMMKARVAEQGGGTVFFGSAADFGKLIAAETEKWGQVATLALPAELTTESQG